MLGLVTDTTVFNVLSQSMVNGYRLKLNSPPDMTERLLPLIQPLLTRVEKKLSQWPDLDTACFSYKTKVKQPSSFTFLTSACVSACDSRQQELMVYLMTLHE